MGISEKESPNAVSFTLTSDIFKSQDPQTFRHDYKKTALY